MAGSTVVINFKKWNLLDKKLANGKTQKGVASGSLIGIMKHNQRTEIDNSCEHKKYAGTNIDPSKSAGNVYFQSMTIEDIAEIKDQAQAERKNSVPVFSLVFDFQDEDIEGFDIQHHKTMIDEYLSFAGITDEYSIIDYCYHQDEEAGNPHYHVTFSAKSKTENKFNVNSWFEPELGDPILDKNGEATFKRHNRGKLKGEYMIDEQGNKIVKRKRLSATQFLQDSWSDFLEDNGNYYRNDREFSSVLQFTNDVWRKFSQEDKDLVYTIREAEQKYHKLLREGYKQEAEEIANVIMNGFAKIFRISLKEAHTIGKEKLEAKQKRKEQRLAPKPH